MKYKNGLENETVIMPGSCKLGMRDNIHIFYVCLFLLAY